MRRFAILLLVPAAVFCARPTETRSPDLGIHGHPRLEVYCPAATVTPQVVGTGGCSDGSVLVPVGCMYDDHYFWCRCGATDPSYQPPGAVGMLTRGPPVTYEWDCWGPPPDECYGTVQRPGERPQLDSCSPPGMH